MNVSDFFNSYEFYELEECRTIEIITKSNVDDKKYKVTSLLRKKNKKRGIEASFVEEALMKVYEVIERLDDISDFNLEHVDFDPYEDESVVIYFKDRSIRLNLYVNMLLSKDEEDDEEAYLDFQKGDESHLIIDTIPNVVNLLNKLLR